MAKRRISISYGVCLLVAMIARHPVLAQLSLEVAPQPDAKDAALPTQWLKAWDHPSARHRPLQIVHGIPAQRATVKGMEYYQELGLGGLVCNVDFDHYLQSEEHWNTLITGVKSCSELGMIVWLYDEKGYPSGAAGGLVLQENPQFEACELAFDPSRDDPFIVRPAYEHTHASNNFHAARRYINLIDDRAVKCFVQKTHQAYYNQLGPYFGKTIQAAFTDEPSLIAVNIGPLPDDVRKNVRIVDAVDESVAQLSRVPWSYDLAERYRQRYGQDLLAQRRSLFVGQTPADRQIRRQYWALIADLMAKRFFGTLEEWCGQHQIASSGHTLWEEQILHHVPFEGNGLKCLARMDIPGLDLLNSNPAAVNQSGWLTAGLPASAAMLEGHRRVMTEVSDFSQKLGGQGPVSLAQMQAVAGWQASWGVTDFTLYYAPTDRPAGSHRAYCDFVGRLNAILASADRRADVLLYYPIYDLWAEYLPVAGKLTVASQSQRAQQLVGSFMRFGQALQKQQIAFTLIDHEYLARATLDASGGLTIAGHTYRTLCLPAGVELPSKVADLVADFRDHGGVVVQNGAADAVSQQARLQQSRQRHVMLRSASDQIAMGRFERDGQSIILLVNVMDYRYQGHLATGQPSSWHRLDPTDGTHTSLKSDKNGDLELNLPAYQTVIFIGTDHTIQTGQ